VSDGAIPAYFARPAQGQRLPVVLVIQEIFGVHEHIRDVCRRFARRGALAVAPEMFARQGNPATVTDMQVLMRDIVARVPDAQVMSDLDATVKWARGERGTTAGGHPISPEAQTSVANVYPYTRASPGPIVEVIGVGKIVPPAMYNTLPRTEPATNCLAVGRLLPAVRDGCAQKTQRRKRNSAETAAIGR
jgi:hypothetical protein